MADENEKLAALNSILNEECKAPRVESTPTTSTYVEEPTWTYAALLAFPESGKDLPIFRDTSDCFEERHEQLFCAVSDWTTLLSGARFVELPAPRCYMSSAATDDPSGS